MEQVISVENIESDEMEKVAGKIAHIEGYIRHINYGLPESMAILCTFNKKTRFLPDLMSLFGNKYKICRAELLSPEKVNN
jgi:hypothetical protein